MPFVWTASKPVTEVTTSSLSGMTGMQKTRSVDTFRLTVYQTAIQDLLMRVGSKVTWNAFSLGFSVTVEQGPSVVTVSSPATRHTPPPNWASSNTTRETPPNPTLPSSNKTLPQHSCNHSYLEHCTQYQYFQVYASTLRWICPTRRAALVLILCTYSLVLQQVSDSFMRILPSWKHSCFLFMQTMPFYYTVITGSLTFSDPCFQDSHFIFIFIAPTDILKLQSN